MVDQMTDNPKYVAAQKIALGLRSAGHQAYFAGGCVRDLLLGVEPKDFVVATSATPDIVMAMFPKTYSVGAHFGVVLVCTADGSGGEIATEVATFRNDGAYSDGRRPDAVRFSIDPREDVLRRFVTLDGARADYGVVLDPVSVEIDTAASDALRAAPRAPRPMIDRGIASDWLRARGEPLDLGGTANDSASEIRR